MFYTVHKNQSNSTMISDANNTHFPRVINVSSDLAGHTSTTKRKPFFRSNPNLDIMGGTYQQPIANWGEPSNMHRENDFLYSKTATNIIEANVNSVRDYKANIYEIQKKHIQKIH